jgi:multidrug efflux system outer membrane protein
VPAGLPVELLARRPELLAAGLRVDAALARADAARADLWPRLVLTANGGSTSSSLGDLLDGDFSAWGLAARLAQPVVDGGRRRAGIEALDEEGLARGREFAGALLTACAEVEDALDAELHLAAQVEHLGRARAASDEARRLADDEYRAGLVGIVTSLEAQRRELAAERALLDARAALLANRVALHVALGGGFDARE